MKSVNHGEVPDNLKEKIVQELIHVFDKENPIAQIFTMAKDRF